MQYLSYETCKHLKDAGFPQPEKAIGQTWYVKDNLTVICEVEDPCLISKRPRHAKRAVFIDGIMSGSVSWSSDEYWTYCPRATDILRLIDFADICTDINERRPNNIQILHNGESMGEKEQTNSDGKIAEILAKIWLNVEACPY